MRWSQRPAGGADRRRRWRRVRPNGVAIGRGLAELDSDSDVWLDTSFGKVSIGPLIDLALALC
jgi:hypothetical protein